MTDWSNYIDKTLARLSGKKKPSISGRQVGILRRRRRDCGRPHEASRGCSTSWAEGRSDHWRRSLSRGHPLHHDNRLVVLRHGSSTEFEHRLDELRAERFCGTANLQALRSSFSSLARSKHTAGSPSISVTGITLSAIAHGGFGTWHQSWAPRARSRLNAALIKPRWVKACGKLPRASPL